MAFPPVPASFLFTIDKVSLIVRIPEEKRWKVWRFAIKVFSKLVRFRRDALTSDYAIAVSVEPPSSETGSATHFIVLMMSDEPQGDCALRPLEAIAPTAAFRVAAVAPETINTARASTEINAR